VAAILGIEFCLSLVGLPRTSEELEASNRR
jgi:hypothetical protein